MVWGKALVGGTPPSLFWGQRIQRKLEFLSKVLYRQVHWCAALFCRTIPDQAKIPQNRQISMFLIFLDKIRVGGPPPYFGAVETKKNVISREKPLFVDFLNFGGKQLLKS